MLAKNLILAILAATAVAQASNNVEPTEKTAVAEKRDAEQPSAAPVEARDVDNNLAPAVEARAENPDLIEKRQRFGGNRFGNSRFNGGTRRRYRRDEAGAPAAEYMEQEPEQQQQQQAQPQKRGISTGHTGQQGNIRGNQVAYGHGGYQVNGGNGNRNGRNWRRDETSAEYMEEAEAQAQAQTQPEKRTVRYGNRVNNNRYDNNYQLNGYGGYRNGRNWRRDETSAAPTAEYMEQDQPQQLEARARGNNKGTTGNRGGRNGRRDETSAAPTAEYMEEAQEQAQPQVEKRQWGNRRIGYSRYGWGNRRYGY